MTHLIPTNLDQINQNLSNVKDSIFIAPEILERKLITNKSDSWSIGSLYHFMLFGKKPYENFE